MKAPPGWAQNEVHGVNMGWVGSKLGCESVLFALGGVHLHESVAKMV